jgi:hypothetical protein
MADPVQQAPPRALAPSGADEWPAEAADTIVRWVDAVRSKTTGPALTVARAVVYGLLAALLGSAALVVGVVLMVRVLDAYLPNDWVGEQHVWVVYLGLGLLFSVVGLFLWSRRNATAD